MCGARVTGCCSGGGGGENWFNGPAKRAARFAACRGNDTGAGGTGGGGGLGFASLYSWSLTIANCAGGSCWVWIIL